MRLRLAWARLRDGARAGEVEEIRNPWMESPLDPAEALWLLRQGLTPGFYESLSSPLEGQVARPEGPTLNSPPLEGDVACQG